MNQYVVLVGGKTMSAKMKTILEVKKVIDHDCGNYTMGELDFINYAAIDEYIQTHGEFGYREFSTFLNKCSHQLWESIIDYREENHNGQCKSAVT